LIDWDIDLNRYLAML